jgi:hypothetical protein
MGYTKRRVRASLHSSSTQRFSLAVEALESRTVPHATIGAWPHPELVTVSFMPDGTYLADSLNSNLFASLSAKWPAAVWQGQILLAAQTWAQVTNLNFAVVPDSGLPLGAGTCQQGDPAQGDIRIGGFNFGSSALGGAWFPPPVNNFPGAGDLFFNTAQPFNLGTTYDLYTVAVHEFGHALGLLHSSDYPAAMYGAYVGAKGSGLTWDDLVGIRSLYSANAPRSPDGFGFYTNSFQTVADLTGAFDPVTQTLVGAYLDITYPGQAEYYRFLAPPGTSSQLTVTIQSSGLSLLSPYVVLYDAYQRPIAAASGYGQDGTTISVTVGGVVPTQLFWLRVSGAEFSSLGTGRYALILNFGMGPSPVVAPANTATLTGSPIAAIGGWYEQVAAGQDAPGFDSFEVRPGEVARPARHGSTPQPVRGVPGSARTLASVAAELLRRTGDPSSQPSPRVYSVQPALTAVVTETAGTPPPPLLDAGVPRVAHPRIENAGGNLADLLPDGESPEDGTSLMGSGTTEEFRLPNTHVATASSSTAKWRAACTAYFAEETSTVRQQSHAAAAAWAGRLDTLGGLDSASALTGLTMALGGYSSTTSSWRAMAIRSARFNRTRFRFRLTPVASDAAT